MQKVLEPDIKATVINYLIDKELVNENSILMSEITIGNNQRRIDLAVYTKGKLTGFEIKSEADSLVRLKGQVDTYLNYFDKVIVVTDKKFSLKALNIVPKSVGIWEVENNQIKVKSRGKLQSKLDKKYLLKMMGVTDLLKVASSSKLKTEKHREALESALIKVSSQKLRIGIEHTLKRKYKKNSDSLLKVAKNRAVTTKDVQLLSRFHKERENQKKLSAQSELFWSNIEKHVAELTNFVNSATTTES